MLCSSKSLISIQIITHSIHPFLVSGEIPVEPVASRLSGHVFEKSLILKVIAETGKCPVTGQFLSEADLLPLKG